MYSRLANTGFMTTETIPSYDLLQEAAFLYRFVRFLQSLCLPGSLGLGGYCGRACVSRDVSDAIQAHYEFVVQP